MDSGCLRSLLVAAVLILPARLAAQGVFIRGDSTQDRTLDISDPIFTLNFLFLGGPTLTCLDAADVDDSEVLDISDGIALLNFLFVGGAPPRPPFPAEGVDPEGSALNCANGELVVRELRVSPEELVFYGRGETEPLSVIGVLSGAPPGQNSIDLRQDERTSYRSDRVAVAQVSSAGLVTAVGPGTAAITVNYHSLTGSMVVRVLSSASGAPTLRIAGPPDGAVVTSPSVTVAGTVSDPLARVKVMGTTVAVEAGTGAFRAPVTLSPGPNRLQVQADLAAGSAHAELTVTFVAPGSDGAVGPDGAPLPVLPVPFTTLPDREAPQLVIQSPRSGTLLLSTRVEVRGTVNEPQAVVRVNGARATVQEGIFSARITLPRGQAQIVAEAIDAVGNRSSQSVNVNVDSELPAVSITQPALTDLGGWGTVPDGVAVVSASPVEVRGTLSHPGMRVSIQGAAATVTGTAFSGTAPLVRGLNRVAVVAELPGDPPRRAIAARRVVLDLDPPVIEIVYPPAGLVTRSTPLRVIGRVRDPGIPPGAAAPVKLEINGTSVDTSGGSFELAIPLAPGINTLALQATDGVGRKTTQSLNVSLDTLTGGPSLEAFDGGGQTVGPGASLPRPLVARVRDASGALVSGVPVIFRVESGEGLLTNGAREIQVTTDVTGEAQVSFTAGPTAGPTAGRGHLVTARSPGRRGSPVAFSVTVVPGAAAALVAHSPRWEIGMSGQTLPRPLLVRALDGAGNPLAGVAVEFRVISGSARLAGADRVSAVTGPAGLAAATVTLPGETTGDERSIIVASASGGLKATFTADAKVPGAPADTRLRGQVLDLDGRPLKDVPVRCVDLPQIIQLTDASGLFDLAALPWGPVLLEFLGAPGPGGAYAGARREVRLVVRDSNVLPEPVRLTLLAGGPRMAEIPVSETSGGTAAVAAVPGLRLEVAPGAAHFPDGTRRGRVALVAASLDSFGVPVPGAASIEFPVLVAPEGVRFDPPAVLHVPSSRRSAGQQVLLNSSPAEAGGFIEAGAGRVTADRAFVVSLPGLGLSAGGHAFYSLPGPGGASSAVEGRVSSATPGSTSVDQREASPVTGFNVYAHSGEFFLEEVDLELRGRGIDYRFRRRYESRHAFRGSLGFNWEHEYADRRLEPIPGSDNLLRADGRGRFDEYLATADGGYLSPIGVFARLSGDAQGLLVEREADGTRYLYHPPDGSGLSGRLLEISDAAGNRLQIEHDGEGRILRVVDTLGRAIDYAYDEEDRILQIADFSGRLVDFTYDSRGDLVSVTGPSVVGTPNGNDFPVGRITRYEYSTGSADLRLEHNLLRIFAPNELESGPPFIENHYQEDPASPYLDRVVAQDWGGVNSSEVPAGGRLTIEYRLDPSPDPADLPAGELVALLSGPGGTTVLTDRRGLKTEIEWSRLGLATAVRRFTRGVARPQVAGNLHPGPGLDPPFYETSYRYNAEGCLAEVVFPRGNRVVYERDEQAPLRWSRANVIRETRFPAPGAVNVGESRAGVAVTTFAHDPLFARCVREVSPRGNDPQYVPPNGGETSPERYAVRRFLDYQEGAEVTLLAAQAGLEPGLLAEALEHAGVELGLGDLNGDGESAGAGGNVVLVVHPTAAVADGGVQEARETAVYNHLGQLVARTDPDGAVTRFRYHPESDPDGDGQPSPLPGLNPNTGGYLAEKITDSDTGGPFPPAGLSVTYRYDLLGQPAGITDGRGNTTELLFNQVGELVQYRAPFPFNYRRWFRHDANGNLTAVEIENFTANLDGFPLPVPSNRFFTTSFGYDLLDRVVGEIREVSEGEAGPPGGAETRYRYDANGNLESIVHPQGDLERLTYDDRDLLLERIRGGGTGPDPGGEAVDRFDYDENGNLIRVTGPEDLDGDGKREVSEYRYDGFDRLVASIDPAGGTWVVERDPEGRPVAESFLGSPGGPTPSGGGANVLLLRVLRSHDERGREYRTATSRFGPGIPPGSEPALETRFFDRSGRLVRRLDATGGTWTVDRDGAGRPARSTDPLGNQVYRQYDTAGNLVLETRTELSDAVLNPGAGRFGDQDYDLSGRFQDVQSTGFVYDALNRLSVSLDGTGRTLRFRYDSRGNLVHRTDAVGTVITAGTDPELAPLLPLLAPRQIDQANSHGNQVHYEYDGLNRLVHAVNDLRREGSGQTGIDHGNPFNDDGTIDERFEWDGNGRLVAWSDDRGNRTLLTYDRLGRLRVRRDVDLKEERCEYDLAGNLVRLTDRMGTVIHQTVDVLGRPVRREVEPGSGDGSFSAEGTRLQLFEYDGLGRPTLAFDGNQPDDPADDALVLRSYDSLGALALECQGPFVVETERDVSGRAAAIVYPNGRRVSLPRNALGRPVEIGDGARTFAAFSNLGAGRVLARTLGNGLSQTYFTPDGDAVLRLTGANRSGEILREDYLKATGERTLGYEYGYDRAGRRLFERQIIRQGRGPSLRYDSIGRIREIQPDLQDPRVPFPTPTVFTRLFPDGAHNPRLAIVDFVEKRTEVDPLDRLTLVDGRSLTHDQGGNLAATGGLGFRYDGLGRLTRVLRGGATAVKYAYDAVGAWDPREFRHTGRLSRREVLLAQNGDAPGAVRTVFLLDRPIEERAAAGGLLRQYLWAPDGRAAAAIDTASGTLFYLSDGAGSVAGVADSRGALLEEVRYDYFGAPAFRVGGTPADVSALGNRLLHGGRRWEPTARLYEFGARHYSPDLGRFLNRGGPLAIREPLTLNRYALLDAVNGFGPRRPELEEGLPPLPAPAAPPVAPGGTVTPGAGDYLPPGLGTTLR